MRSRRDRLAAVLERDGYACGRCGGVGEGRWDAEAGKYVRTEAACRRLFEEEGASHLSLWPAGRTRFLVPARALCRTCWEDAEERTFRARLWRARRAWQFARLRRAVRRRDGRQCRGCGVPVRWKTVHCAARFPGHRDPANWRTLCRGCHADALAAERERNAREAVRWRELVAEMTTDEGYETPSGPCNPLLN